MDRTTGSGYDPNICFIEGVEDLNVVEPAPARARLLKAAMDLVSIEGPHRTTIRDIARLSGTNIAAVNYHFGSKAVLMQEVLFAIFEPINARRGELLDGAIARAAGKAVPVADLLDALNRPVVESLRSEAGLRYVRTLQHIRAFPNDPHSVYVMQTFDPVAQRFIDEMCRTLPHLGRDEMIWRYEMARGAMLHIVGNCDPLSGKLRQLYGPRESGIDLGDTEAVLAELRAFVVVGLSAPSSWPVTDPQTDRR
ncbi:TetR/AcrR family transcriptional regulator [Pseudoroseicyclus aestuarii]|uniref:TetR family transcriptional regulator n=1 Tax=Pseudoroseicyclus aestuarii TaxID=1795041 RepID=A0A318SY54_9RHOB|nr:TetR/AcrR family transcriptional regulator [Pseudoroseicyclus aestuarii]PYE85339.1 TetR family transcriptional regulator [Pseudoroseicyclus aestuarii]